MKLNVNDEVKVFEENSLIPHYGTINKISKTAYWITLENSEVLKISKKDIYNKKYNINWC